MKKFLVLTSSILLIAAACNKQAAVSPSPTPTPNPTSTVQTYSNDQYSFELKYDSNIYSLQTTGIENSNFRSDIGENNRAVVSLTNPKTLYPNTDLESAYVTVSVNSQSQTNCGKAAGYQFSDLGTEVIDGVTFKKMEFGDAAAGTQHFGVKHVAYKSNTCYVLSEVIVTSGYGAIDGITQVDKNSVFSQLDKVVSSFGFMNSVSAADWKDYTSPILNGHMVAFSYPSDWTVSCANLSCYVSNKVPEGIVEQNQNLCYLGINFPNQNKSWNTSEVNTYKDTDKTNCSQTLTKIEKSIKYDPLGKV